MHRRVVKCCATCCNMGKCKTADPNVKPYHVCDDHVCDDHVWLAGLEELTGDHDVLEHKPAQATTTMEVVDHDMDEDALVRTLRNSHYKGGWGDLDPETAREHARELMGLADKFEVGAIIEKRGDEFKERT